MQSYTLKFILIGDSRVGKSQLSRCYAKKSFDNDAQTTVGMEFSTKTIEFEKSLIKAQLWDTAGQERYESMTKIYFRDALGAALVYDVCKKDSFTSLKARWLQQLREHGHEGMRLILVGNKVDLVENDSQKREVSHAEALAFAQAEQMDFLETSALTGQAVEIMFRRLILSTAKLLPDVALHLELAALQDGWMIQLPPEGSGLDGSPTGSASRRMSIRKVEMAASMDSDDIIYTKGPSSLEIEHTVGGVDRGFADSRRRSRIMASSSCSALVSMNQIHLKSSSQPSPRNISTDDGATSMETTSEYQYSLNQSLYSSASVAVGGAGGAQSLGFKPRMLYMNYWTGDVQEELPTKPADPGLLYVAGSSIESVQDLDAERLKRGSMDERALTERSSSARTFPLPATDAESKKPPRRCFCTIA